MMNTRTRTTGVRTLLFVVAVALLLQGCVSLTGFQDGRTLGEGNFEVIGSLNMSSSPNFREIRDDGVNIDEEVPTIPFPSSEIFVAYGITDRMNIGVRMNSNTNMGLNFKYQVMGDLESPVALSLGAEVGSFSLLSPLVNAQVPVYFSMHPTETFTFFLSPRYIYQFTTRGFDRGLSYAGTNAGVLLGRRHKFGLDLGYYHLLGLGYPAVLWHVGLGGKFVFRQ
jgi:hypothetical protein